MGRIVLLMALLYGWADPAFNGYRPAALDRPLGEFQRAVREASTELRQVPAKLEELRSMRHLRPLIAAL
jgi:hypothetical protein